MTKSLSCISYKDVKTSTAHRLASSWEASLILARCALASVRALHTTHPKKHITHLLPSKKEGREGEGERERERERERGGPLENVVLCSEVLPNDVSMVSVLDHMVVNEGVLVGGGLTYDGPCDVICVHGFPKLLDQHGPLPLHLIHLGLQQIWLSA